MSPSSVRYKGKGKLLTKKAIKMGVSWASSLTALVGGALWTWRTLDSIWTFTSSVLVLTRLSENSAVRKQWEILRQVKANTTALTLLSSPYLIISWAKSSVGLTRTNAWTFFLEPILAKKKKTATFSVVILNQPLEGRCHWSKRLESMMCSPCFPLSLTASLPFFPPSISVLCPQDPTQQVCALPTLSGALLFSTNLLRDQNTKQKECSLQWPNFPPCHLQL